MSTTPHLFCAGISCVLLAACGGSSATPTPTSAPTTAPTSAPTSAPTPAPSPSPAAAATLLLQVTNEGGFINPVGAIGAVPPVTVDADGRIYMPGAPTGAGFIAGVDVRDTGAAGAAAILAAIKAAGLDKESAGGGGIGNPDAGSTVITVVIDGQEIVTRVGGGIGGPGVPIGAPGASADPAAGGSAQAMALVTALEDPTVGWGGGAVAAQPYAPVGFRVYAAPIADATGTSPVAWPLTTSLATFGSPAAADFGQAGLRSGAVLGADAATLAAGLAEMAPGTVFSSGGAAFTVWVRPLLPDELGG